MSHPQGNLVVSELSFSYGREIILQGISFSLDGGDIFGVLGESGSGKTTLLKLIAGLLEPTRGKIELDGTNLRDVPPWKRDLGFVFQDPDALIPHLTVQKNIEFPFRHGHRVTRDGRDSRKAIGKILDLTGMQSYATRSVRTLSAGQKQRVALARAMVYHPRLLLLDEPLANVDNALKDSLIEMMMNLHDEFNTTFIYVTHDDREAMRVANKLGVFGERELLQFGAPNEIRDQPTNRRVAALVGGWNIFKEPNGLGLPFTGSIGFRPETAHILKQPSGEDSEIVRVPVVVLRSQPWYGGIQVMCETDGKRRFCVFVSHSALEFETGAAVLEVRTRGIRQF